MLTTDVTEGSNRVVIHFSGGIDADELAACRATLERVVGEHGNLRLLVHYGVLDLHHVEPKALWEDLKNIPLIRHIDRCAVVADQEWLRRLSDAAGVVLPAQLRTYPTGAESEALAWIESGT